MPAKDTDNKTETEISKAERPADSSAPEASKDKPQAKEIGGRGGLDPTRYGDWEKAGRCIDF